ncbi:MAG: hypothetical protein WDN28_14820 [Chthoniobacter sp.]
MKLAGCRCSSRPSGEVPSRAASFVTSTSPAVLHRVLLTSKAVTADTPSCPARNARTVSSLPSPSGLTTPIDVTATRQAWDAEGEIISVRNLFVAQPAGCNAQFASPRCSRVQRTRPVATAL